MLLAFYFLISLLSSTSFAQGAGGTCSLASFDRCGPAMQKPGTPSTCNRTAEASLIPSVYGVQCGQDLDIQSTLNVPNCAYATIDICNRLTDPHLKKDRWIWTNPAYIGCALGFWMPSGNGTDAAFAPDFDRCTTGIFGPLAKLCSNPAWKNVGSINIKRMPNATDSGQAVDAYYPSYVIAPAALTPSRAELLTVSWGRPPTVPGADAQLRSVSRCRSTSVSEWIWPPTAEATMLPPSTSIRFLVSCIAIFIFNSSWTWALWPVPVSYQHGIDVLWLANNVAFRYAIANETASSSKLSNATASSATLNSSSSYAIVEAAIQRAHDRLFGDNLVPWKFHPRNSNFEPNITAPKTYISSVTIQQNRTDAVSILKPLAGEVNESYTLSITTSGAVLITAVSSIGVLRALDTFTQLFYKHSALSDGIYCPYAPVSIVDAPKFPHRGLNMDVARDYYAPSDILHAIDALAWNKFNRLHLHVTDGQSWPLDIPTLPELSKKGAYKSDLTYSPQDIAQIQEYGMYRGVEVIIEIDMPGHTSSIHWAYPDLITAYNIQPNWAEYANEPPSGSLKLNSSAVYDFLHSLWEDLLPRAATYSAYFHTGGDELNPNAYRLDETVRSNDTHVIQPLLQKFVDFNHGYVRAAGMAPMVWEEMLLEWNLTLGKDVVVQTWLSDDSVLQTPFFLFRTIVLRM
ncbi:hypothetical protein Q9189_007183 [Teloschistes chrysophthalmus]